MSAKCVSGSASDAQKSYTEFYSRFIEDRFHVNQDFISGVRDVLDSEDVPPENGEDLGVEQCGYLLRYGVHDSCLAEEKFRISAAECKKLRTLCSKGRINVCCVGSQALLGALGVCRVVEEYSQRNKFSDEGRTVVQILIVDKNDEWKTLSEYIVAAAKKEYPNLKLKLDYLVHDMAKKFSDAVALRIELSHIVAMVRYLSSQDSKQSVAEITKNTLTKMKKNAILFYLDHDTKGDLDSVRRLIASDPSFSVIKTSWAPEKHKLHKSSHQFPFPPHLQCDWKPGLVSFATWIKSPETKAKCAEEKTKVVETQSEVSEREERASRRYCAKSSNTLRNSKETFRLVGKFALMDMEKKNKDDSHRQRAKEVAVSRYADFDDC